MDWLWTVLWIVGGVIGLAVVLIGLFILNIAAGPKSLTNQLMHKNMKAEGLRIAKWAAQAYPETKAKMPGASEAKIIQCMYFTEDSHETVSEEGRARMQGICKRINGLCYSIGLDLQPSSLMKGQMTSRCLQFTFYVDRALEAYGFPRITKAQKQELLEAMDMAPEGWENWTPEGSQYPMTDEEPALASLGGYKK